MCALMLGFYPVTAVDVFGYIAQGRLEAFHGINPFVVGPAVYPADTIVPNLAFPNEPSQYGPLWALVETVLASAARTCSPTSCSTSSSASWRRSARRY
jgi:hypothetical protein